MKPGNMSNRTNRWALAVCLLVAAAPSAWAQGTTGKKSTHFIAALDFFNNYSELSQRISNPSPSANGLQNSASQAYVRDGVTVKGLVASAALVIDWWLLFGEPTENYSFVWKSSGRYDITYVNKRGAPVSMTITRAKLEPYPDLVKRFDALKPGAVDFLIKWRIGNQSDEDRDKFRNRYGIAGSIGSGMPHVKEGFTTKVSSDGLLFEPSGTKPLSVPGIRQGKGREFLGLPRSYDAEKLRIILDYFNISTGQVIQDFRVTRITWPTGEMKAIAERLDDYVSGRGDSTPSQRIAAAEAAARNLKPYASGGEMAEAFADDTKGLETFKDEAAGTVGIRNARRVFVAYKAKDVEDIRKLHDKVFWVNFPTEFPMTTNNGMIVNERGVKQSIGGYDAFFYAWGGSPNIKIHIITSEWKFVRNMRHIYSRLSEDFSTYDQARKAILNLEPGYPREHLADWGILVLKPFQVDAVTLKVVSEGKEIYRVETRSPRGRPE